MLRRETLSPLQVGFPNVKTLMTKRRLTQEFYSRSDDPYKEQNASAIMTEIRAYLSLPDSSR